MLRAMRTGRLAALLALGVGMLLGSPQPASAGPRDDVQAQLKMTDEGLSRAREVVLESQSRRARDLLLNAARIQESAWEQFRSDRLLFAARLTQEARQTGARALSLAREDAGLQGRARREGEKAMHALQLAREAFEGAPGEQALRLLEEARAQIERGRAQFQEQHYEAALRLAISAQSLIKQALGSASDLGGERVLRELERTDRLMERVQAVVRDSGNTEALRVLEQALNIQTNAWEAYRGGRLPPAFAMTREARALAGRAAELVRGPIDAEDVARALEETEHVLERGAEVVRGSGDENALKIFEKAREHQHRAEQLAEDEQARAALAETRVARSLAKRAIRMAQDAGGI